VDEYSDFSVDHSPAFQNRHCPTSSSEPETRCSAIPREELKNETVFVVEDPKGVRICAEARALGLSHANEPCSHASTSLLRTAYRTRPAVEFMLSLRIAAARCVSVVFMLRFNIALTPLLLCPSATSLTIVFSRGESTWFELPFPVVMPSVRS